MSDPRPYEVLENPWPEDWRVLQLGCGRRPMARAVNHDRCGHAPYVSVAHDLDDMPWRPFWAARGGLGPPYDVVLALDVLEHLADVYGACSEVWELLRPGGLFRFRIAAHDNPASYADLTHRHWATEDSFSFLDPRHPRGQVYGAIYRDSLGRFLRPWRVGRGRRVNPDPRWPARGDWQFDLIKPQEGNGGGDGS